MVSPKRREVAEVVSPSKASRLPNNSIAPTEHHSESDSDIDRASFDENHAEPAVSDAEILEESTEDEEKQDCGYESLDDDDLKARVVPFNCTKDIMEADEELVADPTAYDMLHEFHGEWPCLSFDFIVQKTNNLLSPQDITIVAGSQAGEGENSLTIYQCKNLKRTWSPNESSGESEDSDSDDGQSGNTDRLSLQSSYIRYQAAFNKVAVCPKIQHLAATSTEDNMICVYDLSAHLKRLENPVAFADPSQKPICSFSQHTDESFGLDWQQESSGGVGFASGGRDKRLMFYEPVPGGWAIQSEVITASPLESISWKYGDANIVAVAGHDGSVRIYDKRQISSASLILADHHKGDVNVVSFGTHSENSDQLLSGGDDHMIRLTDLRFPSQPLFKNKDFHQGPICALDWCRHDHTTFVAGSYDDRCSIWDLSAEGGEVIDGWPCQLIFEHCGQSQLHTLRCHPTIPYMCVSAGVDGFSIWRSEDLFEFAKTVQMN